MVCYTAGDCTVQLAWVTYGCMWTPIQQNPSSHRAETQALRAELELLWATASLTDRGLIKGSFPQALG